MVRATEYLWKKRCEKVGNGKKYLDLAQYQIALENRYNLCVESHKLIH